MKTGQFQRTLPTFVAAEDFRGFEACHNRAVQPPDATFAVAAWQTRIAHGKESGQNGFIE